MYKYKLTIAYDGTGYVGWQKQLTGISIQELLEKALSTFLRKPMQIIGASRTDAGVHAKGQVAHFTSSVMLDTYRCLYSLNYLLPKAIRIIKMEEVPLEFHARYSACSKEYHYHLRLNRIRDPFKSRYSYPIYTLLDLDLLKQAAQLCVGTKNFSSFANEAFQGSAAKNPIRTIHRLSVCPEEEGIRLEFVGDGFLYKMVRNLTGTLIEVARGKVSLDQLLTIFSACDRRKAAMAAPSHALFLIEINYDLSKKNRK